MTYRRSLVRLLIFLVVSGALAGYLVVILGEMRFTATRGYSAEFSDVSYLKSGDPVRIAGGQVGTVQGVGLARDRRIKVRFDVDASIELTTATRATVRYKNLLGDRFLELTPGSGRGVPLRAGGTIAVANTTPALALDTLLNGFKPLFVGLDPTQINRLSTDLVGVLQGQAGSVYGLLTSISSLTGTLARNDRLIGDVITNLNTALGSLDDRSGTISNLIVQLQQLVSGLAKDKDPITVALSHLQGVASDAAGLLAQVRPDLRTDVTQLNTLATTLNRNYDTLTYVLNTLPGAYQRILRAGSYGNFFNFYMCGLRFKLDGPNGPVYTPYTMSNAARCK